MTAANGDDSTQKLFVKLKASCVPLLGSSLLTPASIPQVSQHLQDIVATLQDATTTSIALKPSLISYVFYPISTILQRNSSAAIPNRILEHILIVLGILCESWWWDMEERTWEQIWMLAMSVVEGMEGNGKAKERDDETKTAAVHCLYALMHPRTDDEDVGPNPQREKRAEDVFARFCSHAQSDKFIPIVGQTIHSLLGTAQSPHRPLQAHSLACLQVLLAGYITEEFAPSILPGITSAMCRIALGIGVARGWANGDVVTAALSIMGSEVTLAMGDDICIKAGVVKSVDDLESLTQLFTESTTQMQPENPKLKFNVLRTSSWLKATASQLHIALVSLQPLVTHQTPAAQFALASLSRGILQNTALTLPQSQPLLLSYLLSLSVCDFPDVSAHARLCMQDVLAGKQQHALLHVLLQISKDNMSSLPRFLSTRAEEKLVHATGIVEAICSFSTIQSSAASTIHTGIETLLGPNGAIEKWGWTLLSVLEFTTASIVLTAPSAEHLLLTSNTEPSSTPFPEITLRHTSYKPTASLERMFRSLGRAAGEGSVYAIEWFFGRGQNGRGVQNVAALWCAARLLEGAAEVSLAPDNDTGAQPRKRSKRFERLARGIAKTVAELWDEPLEEEDKRPQMDSATEELEVAQVQHTVGILPIRGSVGQQPSLPSAETRPSAPQPMLHQMVLLQLLSISSGILEVRFTATLLDTLFPILHSLTSDFPPLATTALATLQYVSNATSYASPSNLLLANFDYALDGVSRRLSRRWLDLDATSVLVILVKLVGRDVVQRAGDVVEECFDRLDEYHGYEVLVNGLMAVLSEVVEAIAADSERAIPPESRSDPNEEPLTNPMQGFFDWFSGRKEKSTEKEGEPHEDVGPVPQEAWTSAREDDDEEEAKRAEDPVDDPPSTPTQLLVQQIIQRSLYFLTHHSRHIRARILALLSSAATVMPPSLILPSIHQAWPFILNRLADPEPFVVSAAAALVEALATHFGDFMYGRIWDDVWPRFQEILRKLVIADSGNAMARRGAGAVGTESAYTHSHRLYKSLLRTMTAASRSVRVKDSAVWDVIVAHRRFLHKEAHDELQSCARELYIAIGQKNADVVWFALTGTQDTVGIWTHLQEPKWDVKQNADLVLQQLDNL